MTRSFEFVLNGRSVCVEGDACNSTLLQYLRRNGLTGTKEGCAEGDCGACTVALVETDAHGAPTFRAINACIALLPMFAGREVWTVEGIADGGPHVVQQALERNFGSQCGYCTPGIAMSMFEGYYREDVTTPSRVADQLSGNLCRCTGYRPIRDAMKDACTHREAGDRFVQLLANKRATATATTTASAAEPTVPYEAAGQLFFAPRTVAELLRLRAEHPDASLVMGATEIGVEINKKARAFPKLISVEAVSELRRVRRSEDGTHWLIGGAATLTEVEEALDGDIPAIDKMLAVFASRQIRNRASLAGNLVTASPIGDMAPVLLALDATVTLRSLRGERDVALADFFVAYRKTVMAQDEVLTLVHIPRVASAPDRTRIVESYKVSKRREMDIAIVAAGLRVDVDGAGVVRHARLAYGGVAAMPARARKAEALLVGTPWSAASARDVVPTLLAEFSPISDARGSAEYRGRLVGSLFEKFASGSRSEAIDVAPAYTNDGPWAVDAPSRAMPHESGLGHATGAAHYVDDQAARRDMLVLWPVTSPHAHARIARRDAHAARAMPGVAAVLLAEDIPGTNDVGALRADEVLLARDEAVFHGHIVAIVVGETYEQCRAAAHKVEVDYEPLPALLSIEEAVLAESFHTQPHAIRRGDCDAALATSKHRLAGVFESGGQEHFYLESHAAWAECGDDGDIYVGSSTQHPSEIQAAVAHVLHLPRNKVVVQSPRMGGGFGGKETQGNTWAALVALAAAKTRRPVRVQLDRDLDMQLTGKRHPFRTSYDVGFDDTGRVLALRARLYSDGGWALDLSESITDRALFHLDNAYHLPAVDAEGRVCKTNHVSHTAFRGFGGPQGMLVVEEILDRVARRLGLAPEIVRERNLYSREGGRNTTHYEQPVDDQRISTIWRSLKDSSAFDQRRSEITAFNRGSAHVKRGIAITPVKFGISFTASFLNQAGALVLIYRDGSVQVNHGGTEMGQGLYTKILGITMRELGLPAERIRVMKTQTDKVPNTSPTAASAGADLNGAAVRNACETLRERLAPVAARMLAEKLGREVAPGDVRFVDGGVAVPGPAGAEVAFAELAAAAYLAQVPMSATGFYRTPGLAYDRSIGRGKPFHYYAYGAAVTEVEVDGHTGMKCIRRVDILHDVGDSLHPNIDRGQIEGAFVQGAGWLTGEELLWDDKGRLLTHSASTYQIPAFSDAPADFRVQLLPRAAQEHVIHGSKAVGEPPLMLAISVREALKDAIAAFRSGPEEVQLPCPATHEAIFRTIDSDSAKAR